MTEFEALSLIATTRGVIAEYWGNYVAHLSIYLTLIFTYCAGMYVAASALDRVQMIIASSLFFVAAELQVATMITWVDGVNALLSDLSASTSLYEGPVQIPGPGRLVSFAVWQAGIIASIAFMFRAKNKKADL